MKRQMITQRSEAEIEADEKWFEHGRNGVFICPPYDEKVAGAGMVMKFGISSHFFRVKGVRDIETHEPQYGLEWFVPHPESNQKIFERKGVKGLDHYLIDTD